MMISGNNIQNKKRLLSVLVFVGSVVLLMGLLAAATPARAGSSTTGAESSGSGAQPDDINLPIQEGFESGVLSTSAFRSVIDSCIPSNCGWFTTNSAAHAGSYSAFAPDLSNIADQRLTQDEPASIPANATAVTLSFWHRYEFESFGSNLYDGGVLEVSTNGGSTWSDSGVQFTTGGYNGTIATGHANPLAGRQGWGGTTSGAFVQVQANLLSYAGQSILIRFREGSDNSNASVGWWVDDVQMSISSPVACAAASWTLQASYPASVAGAAVVSHNGQIYSFGGKDSVGNILDSAYRYFPASGQWFSVASLPVMRYGATAVSDGTYIYIVGGFDPLHFETSTLWRYDPAINTYTQRTSYTIPTMNHASVYLNGKIFRIGGTGLSSVETNSVEAYNIAVGNWTTVANYPMPINSLTAMAYGGYIYTAGGEVGSNTTYAKTYRYDPTINSWNDAAIADLPLTLTQADSGFINGLWVLVSGVAGGVPTDNTLAWNPASNTWRYLASALQVAYNGGAGVVDLSLYVVGGKDAQGHPTASTQRFHEVPCVLFPPTAAPPTATATPGVVATACLIQFSDVDQNNTFYSNIRCLACRGIINGYGDGTFRPGNNVTRGQLAKIVSNSADFSDPQSTQLFEDVPVGSTFHIYIGRLASRGYMSGYPCGEVGEPCGGGNLPYFRPNANATRGQISKIVSNAAGFNEAQPNQLFEDVAIGSAFHDYIGRLASRGVMSGYPCGGVGEPCGAGNLPYFRPGNNATRGQTSKIVGNTFFPNCQTPNSPDGSVGK